MFEKDLKLSVLFDQYGALLSPKKREAFEAYYSEDLSLAEIAAETGTSRQAVRDLIQRTGEELRSMEEALGLTRRREEGLALCDRLAQSRDEAERGEIISRLREIL